MPSLYGRALSLQRRKALERESGGNYLPSQGKNVQEAKDGGKGAIGEKGILGQGVEGSLNHPNRGGVSRRGEKELITAKSR